MILFYKTWFFIFLLHEAAGVVHFERGEDVFLSSDSVTVAIRYHYNLDKHIKEMSEYLIYIDDLVKKFFTELNPHIKVHVGSQINDFKEDFSKWLKVNHDDLHILQLMDNDFKSIMKSPNTNIRSKRSLVSFLALGSSLLSGLNIFQMSSIKHKVERLNKQDHIIQDNLSHVINIVNSSLVKIENNKLAIE